MTGEAEPFSTDPIAESELLHDGRVVAEHDGARMMLRCRVCGTDVVR